MRSINVLRNSFYALMSFALISLLTIVVRKFFTAYLSVELLGIEGLFSSIFAMMSLAELGISSVISYSLYREIANKNLAEINTLMNIYRYIYTLIGFFVLVVGITIFFLLPYIIHDTTLAWDYIQFAYIIQLCTVLSSYFLAYKRTILVADQKDYMCIRIDTIINAFSNILRLVVIACLQSYILYSLLGLLFNVIANLIIARCVNHHYPFLSHIKVSFVEIRERNILKDTKNLAIQKVAWLVYGGVDSILLSSILGVYVTGLFANYQIINGGIFSIMYKALQGIAPSIGNLVYEGDNEKTIRFFWMLDFFYLLFASYIAVVYALLFQPFMNLFFGEKFLLPESLVLMMCLHVFIMIQFENLCNFRYTVGLFEKDRNMMIVMAIVKLSIVWPAIHYGGVAGLVFSTLVAWLCIGWARMKIVFRYILRGERERIYLWRHLHWSIFELVTIAILYGLFQYMDLCHTYCQLIMSAIMSFILLTLVNYIAFGQTEEFKNIVGYGKSVFVNIKAGLR